ncbi:GlxA family transcriptional regulator [uncultured Tistrella sp.]|uniref:GlxA family transcriptional regulator n=1 Tax=Tistrella mobilis TaxID=171437 RepID=UPI000C08DEDC|nr:GlxA family transcriptional regulator [uncultured Tistrella sp.]MAM76455.1 AraC family transcriptional regulator [Tistrella sp.]
MAEALPELIEIGLLLYPEVQQAAIHGLGDLILIADRLRAEDQPAGPALRLSHWQADAAGAVRRVFDSHPGRPGRPAALILPPSLAAPISPEAAAPLARWLTARHGDGAVLCSVCAGAFLLAETGLLDGRPATTHWNYHDRFASRFPAIRVDTARLLIDDGDLITAGGVMSWTDLGLALIARLLGPALMVRTARFLLIDPPGREQRAYSLFVPRLDHGDAAILKVQHWLQATGAREVRLPDLAARAGLEERTFLRRFRKATGLRPVEYCQHLRITRARERLERSADTVDRIAWEAGYEDPASFRKLFQRITGLTPAAYRERFGVGAGPA